MSRKKFIESVGGSCDNWYWSWSFVNHEKNFVIFGMWSDQSGDLIFDSKWKGLGHNQSVEHIRLVEQNGYALKIFRMEGEHGQDGKLRIKKINPHLEDKLLLKVRDRWFAIDSSDFHDLSGTDEAEQGIRYVEGAVQSVLVNSYERNKEAREKCIEIYGCKCYVCGFSFEDKYGDIGKGFIHVHHEIPLSEIKKEYKVDPNSDLKPLCANCHAIIHRFKAQLEVEDLIDILRERP